MTTLFRGIGWRIFISFSVLLIVLTLILSFVGLKFAQTAATDNAANELRVLSVTLSQQLQRYFKRIESGVKSLSATGGVLDVEVRKDRLNQKRLDRFLKSKLNLLANYEALAVFDLSGNCVASTDSDWIGLPAQREMFFVNGLKHFNFSEIFESKDEDEKVLLVSTPISEGPDPRGVLVGRLRLSSLYDLMGQQLAVAGNADAFLLDSKLRFITPAKSAPDELLQSHLAATPLVQHLQEEFWVGRYLNYKGTEVLGTVLKLPGYGWFLVIERDFAQVQMELAQVKKALFTSTLILLVALIFTTILITHSITKPLQALVEGARRIAGGDLSQPVVIPSGLDEISFLASEFDKMRARLAASQGRLIEQLEESEQRRIENERLAAIGTLASSLAHEIRNPLNAVSLLLSRLERTPQGDEGKLKMIDDMRSEILRLDRLVSDILDYSKPLQLQLEKIDLAQFVEGVVEFYKGIFENKGIRLKLEFSDSRIEIKADRDKLRQALVNLIQNSIDAMENSGGELLIKITQKKNYVEIAIKDTGIGIAETARSRLFDLFFTTKERGTGLGLSTVRKIIDAHRGKILIESIPRKGTSVTMNLPA